MSSKFDPHNRKLKFLVFTAVVIGGVSMLLEPLVSLGFAMTEGMSRRPIVSRSVAYVLLWLGSWCCWHTLVARKELRIKEAVLCYVALGSGMAGVYYLLHETGHDCFSFPAGETSEANVLDFVYFSFVTVTTVGYGDIIPRHSFVRLLVLLQVFFGLVLILRIGIHSGRNDDA